METHKNDGEKRGAVGLMADSPEWTMDPRIASVYLGDIARLQRQIRAKHGMSRLVFGQRFSRRAGFHTFSIFDVR